MSKRFIRDKDEYPLIYNLLKYEFKDFHNNE